MPRPLASPRLLTTEQVARLTQLHVATVRAALRTGHLRGFKVGPRRWRILASEVARWLTDTPPPRRVRDPLADALEALCLSPIVRTHRQRPVTLPPEAIEALARTPALRDREDVA